MQYNGTGNQATKLIPSRPELPDYYTATRRLAERRGQQPVTSSRTDIVIGRRARSCDSSRDSSATPSFRCRAASRPNLDMSEDGRKFGCFVSFDYFGLKVCFRMFSGAGNIHT